MKFICGSLCLLLTVCVGVSLASTDGLRLRTGVDSAAVSQIPRPSAAARFDLLDDPPAVDPMNCSCVDLATCQAALADLTADPCASSDVPDYNVGFHIGAIFVILVASMLGSAIPLLVKYVPRLGVPPFVLVCGKCVGTGVVLACALVHMIQPGNESLTSPCIPTAFNTDYAAYAFMYAMVAAIVMQFIDFSAEQYLIHNASALTAPAAGASSTHETELAALGSPSNTHVDHNCDASGHGQADQIIPVVGLIQSPTTPKYSAPIPHGHEGHVHSVLLSKKARATLSAYLLEFGITVHSVFIGLQNGVVGDSELNTLLIALSFHQFFEGVALGSRLVDAELPSHWHEAVLSFIFSISAPIGIMIGVILTVSLEVDGQTYLLTQGTLDGVCGGILLYIGFQLLIRDMPQDMQTHCSDKEERPGLRRMLMFCSLWVGAGVMAFIGKYL